MNNDVTTKYLTFTIVITIRVSEANTTENIFFLDVSQQDYLITCIFNDTTPVS